MRNILIFLALFWLVTILVLSFTRNKTDISIYNNGPYTPRDDLIRLNDQ